MPLQSNIKRNYGPSGPANVRMLKGIVRIEFQDGDQVDVTPDQWNSKYPAGKYFVGCNRERNKITFISPPPGSYIVKFGEVKHADKELPIPYIERGGPRESRDGKSKWFADDEPRFRVSMVVVDGPCDGLEITYWLPYIFTNAGNGECVLEGRKNQLKRMEEFLRAVGFDTLNDSIPYSDNVLPAFNNIIQKRNEMFSVTLGDKGYVDSIVRIPASLLPKKSAKKSVKK